MPLLYAHEKEVSIELTTSVGSIQGKKTRRNAVTEEIRNLAKVIPHLFSDDLNVEIQLFRMEQEQYESDRAADIDNVIKPILDGLTGPDGVMIDDSQVQQIGCSWLDATSPTPKSIVTINSHHGTRVTKDSLLLIHMGKQLYFPLAATLLDDKILDLLEGYKKIRADADVKGLAYESIRALMPSQRYFHRTRLRGFTCVDLEAARKRLS